MRFAELIAAFIAVVILIMATSKTSMLIKPETSRVLGIDQINFLHISKKPLFIIIVLITVISLVILSVTNGLILPNGINIRKYPVRGVDVSEYQGKIDWKVMQKNDIKFAYIKATEGSFYIDKQYKFNWENAKKTNIKIGAYHFLSFDSDGKSQARNFIGNVPDAGSLQPAVDVELYGRFKTDKPSKEKVKKILGDYLKAIENYYGAKPIIYFTEESFNLYYDKSYSDKFIWIRNVFTKPNITSWKYWQYTDKGRLSGYSGKDTFIDLDVFNGNLDYFEN
jgi:lysozyme